MQSFHGTQSDSVGGLVSYGPLLWPIEAVYCTFVGSFDPHPRLLNRTAHMSTTFINAAAEGNVEQAGHGSAPFCDTVLRGTKLAVAPL